MAKIHRSYLDKLVSVIGTEDIKVITGVRRSGKSVLLKDLRKYLEKTNPNANIIYIDYSLLKFNSLKTAAALDRYVTEHSQEGKDNKILIDEVQMCEGFELAINSFHAEGKYDIYVTGSNAFLSSSDLATLFVGRTFTIEVFPFSFKEFMTYFNYTNKTEAIEKYIAEGGIAGSYQYPTMSDKLDNIQEVYNTLIIRDIQEKYKIQNPVILTNVSNFLMDNISRITSMRNIANALQSSGTEVSNKTVGLYAKYLCEAYAFYKVQRYDIKGKRHLASLDKYYLSDHSFRAAVLGSKSSDLGSIYENIVAIELMRRKYEVYAGALRNGEIDFVAIRGSEKLYIQVCYSLSNEATLQRELTPLMNIPGGYTKLLIARTEQPEQIYEGIRILDIADWLLDVQTPDR